MHEKLTLFGEKLYGRRWKKPLVQALGYRRETISRWALGKQPIPDAAVKAIDLLNQKPAFPRLDVY